MAIRVVTDRGRELRLGRRLDNGGQGVVYEVDQAAKGGLGGARPRVAKLLLRPADPAATRRRLASLVRQGRSPRALTFWGASVPRAAWPTAVITTTDLDIPGYLMPDMRSWFQPIDCMISAELRRTRFPEATWATSLAAATSLAGLIVDLHAKGYAAGDLKRGNLWVNKHGTVAISDVDSFQFADAREFFACTSRTRGYTAPEGIDVAEPVVDEWSDYFVLALLVHELLMSGMHPFFGLPGDGSPYISLDDNIRHGRARLARASSVQIGRDAPPLSVLPASLGQLFRRCFGEGVLERRSRPTAGEWQRRLAAESAADRLRRCDQAPCHVYQARLSECPWCLLAAEGHSYY